MHSETLRLLNTLDDIILNMFEMEMDFKEHWTVQEEILVRPLVLILLL